MYNLIGLVVDLPPIQDIRMQRLIQKGTKVINVKYGIIGALFMGSWVYYLNMDHDWPGPLTAGLKQASYTFFVGYDE